MGMTGREFGIRVGAIKGRIDNTNKLAFFGYGVYESDDCPYSPIGNPAIRLDSGDVVYGLECWWGPEDKIKETLDKYVAEGYEIEIVETPDRSEWPVYNKEQSNDYDGKSV